MAEEPGSKANMMYVTNGTVQIELKTRATEITINPVQGFTVKYRETDYIVFMPDELPSSSAGAKLLDAKAVEKTRTFSAPVSLKRALTDAALKSIKLEIKVDFSKTPEQKEIVSIKIPATL